MPDNGQPQNLAAAVADISERASVLIREEIELAKAEITENVTKLIKGAVVAIAAGIFLVFGLVYLLHSAAWGLFALMDARTPWLGYLIVAVVLFLLGGVAGYLASKWLKTKPMPTMAIDEAQRIRDTVKSTDPTALSAAGSPDPEAHGAGVITSGNDR